MLLQSIFAPLWQPMKDHISLCRALATGGRIPGTHLVMMPVAAGKCRFGLMEHFMMALAGAWLLFRVICSDLNDMKLMKRQQEQAYRQSIGYNKKDSDGDADTETTTTTTTTVTTTMSTTMTTTDSGTSSPTDDTANQSEEANDDHIMIDNATLNNGTEATLYWGCHQLRKPAPIFRFTRLQLEKMLSIDQDEYDTTEYEEDYSDDIVQFSGHKDIHLESHKNH